MSNNQALAAILAHPRVREIRPQWYRAVPKCPYCGGLDVVRRAYLHCLDRECNRVFPETDEYAYEYTGPDLARHDQIHELLGLADAMAEAAYKRNRCDVNWDICHQCFCASVLDGLEESGPTRTDAVIAAIARALEVSHASHVS